MQKTVVEGFHEKRIARLLTLIGQQETAKRFISRYGKQSTKTAYLYQLELYLGWLKEQRGILQTLDELIRDHLMCVFNSEPTDVRTKRKHTDMLFDFIKDYMVRKGYALNARSAFLRQHDNRVLQGQRSGPLW
jgi:hypothetical protein